MQSETLSHAALSLIPKSKNSVVRQCNECICVNLYSIICQTKSNVTTPQDVVILTFECVARDYGSPETTPQIENPAILGVISCPRVETWGFSMISTRLLVLNHKAILGSATKLSLPFCRFQFYASVVLFNYYCYSFFYKHSSYPGNVL